VVRQNIVGTSPWEPVIGYSRAVRVGEYVHVSGTTGLDAHGDLVGEGDAYAQSIQALRNIQAALQTAGATMGHVVRTRMFVLDIENNWEAVGRAHGDFFASVRPAATMVEVSRLIHPAMLVEIEADAYVGGGEG
jgi:enamine deaminase RidA (YjgF/YER057c/UK114 family)